MLFHKTPLEGCYVIEPERIQDHRGFFARVWCRLELEQHGLKADVMQSNVGFSVRKGTLRGLHYQTGPHAEVKVVRCTRGAMFDVVVDLRPQSPTYTRWFGVELTPDNGKMIYVPEGFAQGYVTLADDTEMNYHTSKLFHRESAIGVRFDDPAFGIEWPVEIAVISDQDKKWPDYKSRQQSYQPV
ncbi:dTDP-4-dehydrorhamnose 3,5-epimerase [Nitrospira moscoviensis]|uniref:dTDP-4-dehydrorhamnose 3,5-epimerase n=1 Tax=Nitrospira moscoviensis TaxID=42253 RepID=A0A0K2GFQ8_NITMO|nr:dTDP-4-dehydrorhamnose 3,5-epimerase [Nitrospira moscoviensis]ALA59800.1 dTDP-4-dehydrorhamnose 3,5-epimerase [Nitrospira moscoviensis]